MYTHFNLVLMLTQECNLRCDYCYVGKGDRRMPEATARKAIDRASSSISDGGVLELCFFGGEPLLYADLVQLLIDHAENRAPERGLEVRVSLTTNGTIDSDSAWSVMKRPGLSLGVSCDGLPHIHDRHRHTPAGCPTSERVEATIRRLVAAGTPFHAVIVVRPDTCQFLREGMEHLQRLGVVHIEPTLDLWTRWTTSDIDRLEHAVADCAGPWGRGLPKCGIGWFDEKAAALSGAPQAPTGRCGFGDGQIAVAPSGRLYPCERLIGDDDESNPMVLPDGLFRNADFLRGGPAGPCRRIGCENCELVPYCNTFCRCANLVRTGDAQRPDLLLCSWNKACLRGVSTVLGSMPPTS